MASWMFGVDNSNGTNTNTTTDTESQQSTATTSNNNNNNNERIVLRINECQVCKCEFPNTTNFDPSVMTSTQALDYALLTVIVVALSINRRYSDLEFTESDALVVQNLLGRYSTTFTYYTTTMVLDHAKFLHHTLISKTNNNDDDDDDDNEDCDNDTNHDIMKEQEQNSDFWTECLYPILLQEFLSLEDKRIVVRAIEGTATPGDADALVEQASKILFCTPKQPKNKTKTILLIPPPKPALLSNTKNKNTLNHPSQKPSNTKTTTTAKSTTTSATTTTKTTMATMQTAVDEYHLWMHKGCQKLLELNNSNHAKKKKSPPAPPPPESPVLPALHSKRQQPKPFCRALDDDDIVDVKRPQQQRTTWLATRRRKMKQ